jgi:hypothetical protein
MQHRTKHTRQMHSCIGVSLWWLAFMRHSHELRAGRHVGGTRREVDIHRSESGGATPLTVIATPARCSPSLATAVASCVTWVGATPAIAPRADRAHCEGLKITAKPSRAAVRSRRMHTRGRAGAECSSAGVAWGAWFDEYVNSAVACRARRGNNTSAEYSKRVLRSEDTVRAHANRGSCVGAIVARALVAIRVVPAARVTLGHQGWPCRASRANQDRQPPDSGVLPCF